MIDLNKISERCFNNAKRMGYKTDKKSIAKHLQSEIKELKKSKWFLVNAVNKIIRDTQCKKKFKKMYELHIKDSTPCEYADFIIIGLTGLKDLGLDAEDVLMNKIRYNEEHR